MAHLFFSTVWLNWKISSMNWIDIIDDDDDDEMIRQMTEMKENEIERESEKFPFLFFNP